MTTINLSIKQLAKAFADGDLSPIDVTENYLNRIEKLNPTLRAFTVTTRERAIAEATTATEEIKQGKIRGPLHGIPYSVKEHFAVRDVPTMVGCRFLADNIAPDDCAAVEKLSEAGMVLLGKNHCVQLGGGITGINQDVGTPHNPWMREHHVPGGSSSGSAVAVASGLAPISLGGDTGGSVRVPASLCGVVGLKTTVGRVTRVGVHQMSSTLDSVGVLGRHVEDVAMVYQHVHGPDEQDVSTTNIATHDVLTGLGDGVEGWRFIVPENDFFDECDSEVEKSVHLAIETLRDLGARITYRKIPELSVVRNMTNRYVINACETYEYNKQLFEEHGDQLDPIVSWIKLGKDVLATEYIKILKLHEKLKQDIVRTLHNVDGFLCPTTLMPAIPISEITSNLGSYVEEYKDDPTERYTRNASIGNMLGLCAVSIPCGFTTKGLPIGLQIYAKPFREDVMLTAAAAFEETGPLHYSAAALDWIEDLIA